jgi:hypothetical protein
MSPLSPLFTPLTPPQNKVLYGMEMRVNWAFQSHQREDTSSHWHVFVGDLGQVRGVCGKEHGSM